MTLSHERKAVYFAVLATLCFAITNMLAKALHHKLDALGIIFFRSLISLLPMYLWLRHTNSLPTITSRKVLLHLPRSVIGIASIGIMFFSLQNLPIAQATTIALSQPLFVALLSPMLIQESFDKRKLLLSLIGFIGVFIILRPNADIPAMILLIASLQPFFYALASISIRFLSKTETPWETIFFFQIFSCVLTAYWALPQYTGVDWNTLPYLCALSASGFAYQFFLTKSLDLAPVNLVAPYNYLLLVWTVLGGVLIWNELPDAWVWLGMALIVGMGIMLNFVPNSKPTAL